MGEGRGQAEGGAEKEEEEQRTGGELRSTERAKRMNLNAGARAE